MTLGSQILAPSASIETIVKLLVPGSSIAGAGAAAAEGAAPWAIAIRLAPGSMNATTAAIAAIVFNIALLIEVLLLVLAGSENLSRQWRNSAIESLREFCPLRVIGTRAVRNVERNAVEQPVVTLHHLVRDFVEGTRDRVHVEHLVGDLFGH